MCSEISEILYENSIFFKCTFLNSSEKKKKWGKMSCISVTSIINSMITFWQKLGVTSGVSSFPLPGKVREFLELAENFFQTIVSILPSVPNLDARGILVCMSFGIPFIIDFIICWFIMRFYEALLHIFDIIASIALAFSVATLIFAKMSFILWMILVISATYLGIRVIIVFICAVHKNQRRTLEQMIHEVKHHFLSGIIPGIKSRYTFKQINEHLHHYTRHIVLIPKRSKFYVSFLLIVVGLILVVVSLLVAGVGNLDIPATLKAFFPPFGIVISVLLVIVGLLKLTMCGTKFMMKVKKFAKRWGIRLLMMFIEMLYIPIVTSLTNHVCITKNECPVGYFPYVKYDLSDPFDSFISHNVTFELCNGSYYNETSNEYVQTGLNCTNAEKCNGYSYFTIATEKQLTIKDIFGVSGLGIAFSLGVIMIGVPFLWYKLISANKLIISVVEVYGNTIESKWHHLVKRMKTTGIFLFCEYKHNHAFWSVFDLLSKAVLLIISIISEFYFAEFIFALPVFNLTIAIILCINMPYLYTVNNILDIILNILGAVYSAFPCCAYFGVEIPALAGYIICILLVVIPIISLVILWYKYVSDINGDDDDPTIVMEISEKEQKERDERIKNGLTTSKTKFLIENVESEQENTQKQTKKKQSKRGMAPNKPKNIQLGETKGRKGKSKKFFEDSEDAEDEDEFAIPYERQRFGDEEEDLDSFDEDSDRETNRGKKRKTRKNYRNPKKKHNNDDNKRKPEARISATKRIKLTNGIEDILDIDACVYQNLPEDFVTVRKSMFNSIYDFQADEETRELTHKKDSKSKKRKRAYESSSGGEENDLYITKIPGCSTKKNEQEKDPQYSVNKYLLSRRFQAMYQVLDLIIDGNTIDKLSYAMSIAVIFGGAAFGWYAATITAFYNNNTASVC